MSTPIYSPGYIVTRAIIVIIAIIVALSTLSYFKKKQRQTAIISQLTSLSSDSSYFQQFYAEDAQKTLVKAIALIVEAQQAGIPFKTAIDRSLGIERTFTSTTTPIEPNPRQKLICNSLNTNYSNFIKLGYTADFATILSMKEGVLPTIPSGPQAGNKPVISTVIDPALSPGLEKVIANLVIQPADTEITTGSDLQIAAAKKLTQEFYEAKLIEVLVKDRILKALSPPVKPPQP